MSKTLTMYMHTLNGKPAYFAGKQVVFALQGGSTRTQMPLARSLAQIRREQQASARWRAKNLFGAAFMYSYVRVSVPLKSPRAVPREDRR
jgi:hypothetical protein